MTDPLIYGLHAPPIPDDVVPIEAFAIVKCLDEEGRVTLFSRRTDGLMIWDAVGMLTVVLDTERSEAKEGFQPDDEDLDQE